MRLYTNLGSQPSAHLASYLRDRQGFPSRPTARHLRSNLPLHDLTSHATRILAACADTFHVIIDGLHFEPRCVDQIWKRRATLALRQPAYGSV